MTAPDRSLRKPAARAAAVILVLAALAVPCFAATDSWSTGGPIADPAVEPAVYSLAVTADGSILFAGFGNGSVFSRSIAITLPHTTTATPTPTATQGGSDGGSSSSGSSGSGGSDSSSSASRSSSSGTGYSGSMGTSATGQDGTSPGTSGNPAGGTSQLAPPDDGTGDANSAPPGENGPASGSGSPGAPGGMSPDGTGLPFTVTAVLTGAGCVVLVGSSAWYFRQWRIEKRENDPLWWRGGK